MAYEVVMSYHLHMPSYFLGTFTEYPKRQKSFSEKTLVLCKKHSSVFFMAGLYSWGFNISSRHQSPDVVSSGFQTLCICLELPTLFH